MTGISREVLAACSVGVGALSGAFNAEAVHLIYGFCLALLIILIGWAVAKIEREQQDALRTRLGVKHDYQVKLMLGTAKTLSRKPTLAADEDSPWLKQWRKR